MFYKRNKDSTIELSRVKKEGFIPDDLLKKKNDGTYYTFYNEDGTPNIEYEMKYINIDIKVDKVEDELPSKEVNTDKEVVIDKEVIVNQDKECCLKVRDKIQDIYESQIETNHKITNFNKTLLVVFLSGVAFGMSDNKWLPYASMMWDFGKDIFVKG